MIPRRQQSEGSIQFIAPRTDPSNKDWLNRTNNTSRMDRYREMKRPPKPATLDHDVITPVSKSGTLITGKGGRKTSR